jgi:hypothetical protein
MIPASEHRRQLVCRICGLPVDSSGILGADLNRSEAIYAKRELSPRDQLGHGDSVDHAAVARVMLGAIVP